MLERQPGPNQPAFARSRTFANLPQVCKTLFKVDVVVRLLRRRPAFAGSAATTTTAGQGRLARLDLTRREGWSIRYAKRLRRNFNKDHQPALMIRSRGPQSKGEAFPAEFEIEGALADPASPAIYGLL